MTATKDIDDIEAITALIQAFFDRVNENDPPGLQTLFVPNAHLTILRQDPPRPPPSTSSASLLPQPTSNKEESEEREEAEEKISTIYSSSIEAFIKMIEDGNKRKKPGTPAPTVHEVPNLEATDVKVDHLFAQAWCPFTVTFDGVLHHYGYFSYTFGKIGEKGWRFEGLTQNYRRTSGWEAGEATSAFIDDGSSKKQTKL